MGLHTMKTWTIRRTIRYWGLIVLIANLTITSCNYPSSSAPKLPRSAQRKTEVANILNPVNPGTPTPQAMLTEGVSGVTPPASSIEHRNGYLLYTTQQGDTLPTLAKRFGIEEVEIQLGAMFSSEGLLPIGMEVQLPDRLGNLLPYDDPLLPDSEIIYGPSAGSFDTVAFASSAGGFLASYSELIKGEIFTGPKIVQRVAIETSTNPRLLLGILEYRSGWVFGHPIGAENNRSPLGYHAAVDTGLYNELMITARLLAQGFYGWRDGSFLELKFKNGSRGRLSPGLNAGSVALMELFNALYQRDEWQSQLYGEDSFLGFYKNTFGDYWSRAAMVEPYLLSTDRQPVLSLPFAPGEKWSLTGGPHITWQTGTTRGALDFAPITGEPACAVSSRWVTASAPGLVVRSERGSVALDLDGDGDEGTGWVIHYMHIAEKDRVAVGTWVGQDSLLGHPSCEGGQSTGTHVHIARKFNGEWLPAEGGFPFVLSGWQAFAGTARYEGYLKKGDMVVTAKPNGASGSTIIRED